MDQGQMEGICLFLRIFPGTLPMNYTTLELARPPPHQEVAREKREYQHQDSNITNTKLT
jgi:hypothetical protein